jgi:hypothetical protein
MELWRRARELFGKGPAKKKAPEKSGALKSWFAALVSFRSDS